MPTEFSKCSDTFWTRSGGRTRVIELMIEITFLAWFEGSPRWPLSEMSGKNWSSFLGAPNHRQPNINSLPHSKNVTRYRKNDTKVDMLSVVENMNTIGWNRFRSYKFWRLKQLKQFRRLQVAVFRSMRFLWWTQFSC